MKIRNTWDKNTKKLIGIRLNGIIFREKRLINLFFRIRNSEFFTKPKFH